ISGGHLQRIRDVNRTQHPREQCLDRRLAGTRWRAPHCDRITCTSFSRPPARGPTHDIILGFREVLMPNPIRVLAFVLLCIQCTLAAPSLAETIPVRIEVNVSKPVGPLRPIWRFFGADEPNYAYMKDGRKLLKELGELRPGNVYFRTHNLLTSGDGTPALKWGSTNAYHVDAQGRPVYDWTILDRIFDAYHQNGLKPYVEMGFMPKDLSIMPEPYQHHWHPGARYDE